MPSRTQAALSGVIWAKRRKSAPTPALGDQGMGRLKVMWSRGGQDQVSPHFPTPARCVAFCHCPSRDTHLRTC